MNTSSEALCASMIGLNTSAAFRPFGALASHFFETYALDSELCSRDKQGDTQSPISASGWLL